MIDITIKGNAGEGKTRTVKAILDYWLIQKPAKRCYVIEGFTKGHRYGIPKNTDVLIKTIQGE